jgi:hypothetical protein
MIYIYRHVSISLYDVIYIYVIYLSYIYHIVYIQYISIYKAYVIRGVFIYRDTWFKTDNASQ